MNQNLNQMVNALVSGENDKAKEYLSQYFNEVGSKLINGQSPQPTQPVNESCAFDVYKDGKKIDTVFCSDKDTAADVKKSLVDHDVYDSDIVVKKARKSSSKKLNEQKFEEETLWLPAHWASALINGDYTGLDDSEEEELNDWLEANPEYGNPTSCSDYPEFKNKHDASDFALPADCLEFTYLKPVA